MGKNVKKAVIAAEDQKFFNHNGFDYQAIEKAYKKTNREKNTWRKHDFATNGKKCFSLATPELVPQRFRNHLYFYY